MGSAVLLIPCSKGSDTKQTGREWTVSTYYCRYKTQVIKQKPKDVCGDLQGALRRSKPTSGNLNFSPP